MTSGRFLIPSFILFSAAAAPAAIVTLPFSGAIAQASDPSKTLGNSQINDPISGYFSYSTAAEDHSGRRYDGILSITLGGQSILLDTALNFVDYSYDKLGQIASFQVSFDSNGPTDTAPLYIYALTVTFADQTAVQPLTGFTPPEHLSPSDFTIGNWRLTGALLDRTGGFTYSGPLAVPETGSLGLALIGFLPLLRRKR